MKGIKKCFLYSFILMLVSLVSSLVIYSPNTYALKHDIKTIPLYSNYIFTGGCSHCSSYEASNPGFRLYWQLDNVPDFSLAHWAKNSVFYSKYISSNSLCGYNGHRNDGYWSSSSGNLSGYVWLFDSYRGFYGSSHYAPDFQKAQCQQPLAFGTANPLAIGDLVSIHPLFNRDSFYGLTPVTTQYYKDLLPYYYDYSDFYLSGDSVTSDNTGITYYSGFKMSDLFPVSDGAELNPHWPFFQVSKFSDLTIPLGQWNSEKEGALTQDRSVEFHGLFHFPGVTSSEDTAGFSWSSDYLTHGTFRLYFDGLVDENGSSSYFDEQFANCDLNRSYTGSDMLLEYTCSLTLNQDYEQASLYLKLENPVTGSYIFETNVDWTWSGFYITTDHDSTPGPDFNNDPTGNHLNEAPGNPYSKMEEAEGDDGNFFSHLTNLFGFTLINPFSPLFTMFTSGSDCASIPILAGMINSSETTYCSWFNSSTRDILTPVLSISAMMLVFGFAVRWLSSSSGNMFEDQTTHKSSNTQPKEGGK